MPGDHIRESIETAKKYLAEYPDGARSKDRPAIAVIEDGLRCRVEGTEGAFVVTDMPGLWVVGIRLPRQDGLRGRLRRAATPQ